MRRVVVSSVLAAALLVSAGPAAAGLDEPIYVIDSPTAGVLANGEYHLQGRIGPESSILLGLRVGFFDVFHVGVSFGMQRVFERAEPSVNDQVGFHFRVRLIPETTSPALAVGFDSQGVGMYDESLDRYERKSKGFYAVLSKNWLVPVGQFSLHGGANYSLETKDDGGPSIFGAGDWEVLHGFSLLLDADAALNDNVKDGRYGGGGIYLDGAVRVRYGDTISMMLIFRDLTGNYEPDATVAREFEVAFVNHF